MGKFTDFASRLFGAKGTATPKNQMLMSDGVVGSELYTLLTGSPSGVAVSESTAMRTSAVHACVGLIGGAVASLPLHIYKRTPEGRERYDSDLWWLFNESPAPAWTSANAWQFTMQSILLKGDSFWVIERASRLSPAIVGFTPVHPDRVVVKRDTDGRNIYSVTTDGVAKVYEQDDVLHFPGLGFDGLRSLSPISYALRNAAGTALAADEHAGQFFAGGARPDHALKIPQGVKLTPEQRAQIQAAWSSQRQGWKNDAATPVLSGGMEVVDLSLNAQDAQLLETRQYGVEEIARIFGVPPHMIGKTDASTSWGSGIEQMSIGFVRYTLRRHLDAIQQEINRKVWPKSRMFFAEFNTDALLDGDSKAQAEYFTKALGGPGTQGWMTINEVRKLKNLPPIAEGDALVMSGAPQQAAQQAMALDGLAKRIEAAERAPQAAPVINVQPTINVDNRMPEQPAPVVNVAAAEVNVPPTVVNVAAPEVSVAAPVVNVAAPEVQVAVDAIMPAPEQPKIDTYVNVTPTIAVEMPARKTETVIERDADGNIVHATQLETSVE